MDASSAAASLYVWLGRFRGVRGRLSDSEATDDVAEEEAEALDASESVEDAAAECAGRGAAAAPAALTISRSSRRPAGMQDDAIAPPGIGPTNKEKELHPKTATFLPENPIGGSSSAETNREGNPINNPRPRMEEREWSEIRGERWCPS